MTARTTWLGAVAVAAAVLTGCSGGEEADSAAAPSSGPTVDPALRVPAPLPTDSLVADPCSALSPAQVEEVGLASPGEEVAGDAGTDCRWRSSGYDTNKIYIGPLQGQDAGISGIYANREQDKYFEPVTIEGYPAVFAADADLRSSGTCALWVGVTDQLVVSVISSIVQGPNVSDPCPAVERVATAMVQHLKEAA